MGLKNIRIASGITQKEAAEVLGLKTRTYQNYENGITEPDMKTASRIACYFDCTIAELFDLEEGQANSGVNDNSNMLKRIRKEKGLTQEQVAKALGIPKKTYQNYERQVRKLTCETLISIAEFYGVSTDKLLGRETYRDLGSSELELLKTYDSLNEYGKSVAVDVLRAIAANSYMETKNEYEA